MTVIGLLAIIVCSIIGKRRPRIYKNSLYVEFGSPTWGGVNFGPFFIVDTDTNPDIVMHEWGHGIQNIILGPLFPFLVAIPSFTRYWYRRYVVKSGHVEPSKLPPYDSVWFEGWATKIGKKYYSEEDYAKSRKFSI